MPIDINKLRTDRGGDPDEVRASERKRGRDGSAVEQAIAADGAWREAIYQMETKKRELNTVLKSIAQRKKKDRSDGCTDLMDESLRLKKLLPVLETSVQDSLIARDTALGKIGNLVAPDVVDSTDEADNLIVRTWGDDLRKMEPNTADGNSSDPTTPAPDAPGLAGPLWKPHHELMSLLGMVELKKGVEMAGHRAYFLKGSGVLLNCALIQYGLSFLRRRGYLPLQPPFFMRKEVMAETAELNDFDEMLYKIPMGKKNTDQMGAGATVGGVSGSGVSDDSNDLFLIATSEQPISALHRNEYVEPKALPFKYAGTSTCFRKEAGSHGKDMAGIFRVHQFEKVEQFVLTTPKDSKDMHEEMIKIAEDFYQSLELPYRLVSIVAGALNDAASKKYDLEAWFPGYQKYRELVSCSNCLDYQARALNVRLGHPKMGEREKTFVHMLNATLVATERTMCCILENYQTPRGVRVPTKLIPYMDGLEFLEFETNECEKEVEATKEK